MNKSFKKALLTACVVLFTTTVSFAKGHKKTHPKKHTVHAKHQKNKKSKAATTDSANELGSTAPAPEASDPATATPQN